MEPQSVIAERWEDFLVWIAPYELPIFLIGGLLVLTPIYMWWMIRRYPNYFFKKIP